MPIDPQFDSQPGEEASAKLRICCPAGVKLCHVNGDSEKMFPSYFLSPSYGSRLPVPVILLCEWPKRAKIHFYPKDMMVEETAHAVRGRIRQARAQAQVRSKARTGIARDEDPSGSASKLWSKKDVNKCQNNYRKIMENL